MPLNHTSTVTRAHGPINLLWLWEAGDTLIQGFNDPGVNYVLLPLYERLTTAHALFISYLMSRRCYEIATVIFIKSLHARS